MPGKNIARSDVSGLVIIGDGEPTTCQIGDDSSDDNRDNRDDSCKPNSTDHTAVSDLFCLFRHLGSIGTPR
jgi:hypothetical protein